jgi:hypothetical protein
VHYGIDLVLLQLVFGTLDDFLHVRRCRLVDPEMESPITPSAARFVSIEAVAA